MTSNIKLSRTGQAPRRVKNRPVTPSPVKKVESTPRIPKKSYERDWASRDARYVRQGQLSIYLSDVSVLAPVLRGKGGGKGRSSYSPQAIALCLVIKVVCKLALRQTQGRVQDLAALMGYTGPVPDHTTISKRSSDPNLQETIASFLREVFPNRRSRRSGLVVLIDSTGLTLKAPGKYYADKHKDKRRGEYMILHIATDAETGEILAHRLTPATRATDENGNPIGPPIGDAPVAKDLINDITKNIGAISCSIGDGAYDAKDLYTLIHEQGGSHIAPFPSNANYSPSRDEGTQLRNATLAQMRRIGEKQWKERTGYHRRSSVESDIGAFKRVFGERISAHNPERVQVEVATKVALQAAFKTMVVAA